LFFAAYFNDA
jgi:molecular chaperone DnaK (HSP70)